MDQAIARDEDQLFKRDADQLLTARTILANKREQRERGPLFKWAELVVQRHSAGQSIASADRWFNNLASGLPGGCDLI